LPYPDPAADEAWTNLVDFVLKPTVMIESIRWTLNGGKNEVRGWSGKIVVVSSLSVKGREIRAVGGIAFPADPSPSQVSILNTDRPVNRQYSVPMRTMQSADVSQNRRQRTSILPSHTGSIWNSEQKHNNNRIDTPRRVKSDECMSSLWTSTVLSIFYAAGGESFSLIFSLVAKNQLSSGCCCPSVVLGRTIGGYKLIPNWYTPSHQAKYPLVMLKFPFMASHHASGATKPLQNRLLYPNM
jgi:hypothetical protein